MPTTLSSTTVCPACGATPAMSARFCPHCGAQLSQKDKAKTWQVVVGDALPERTPAPSPQPEPAPPPADAPAEPATAPSLRGPALTLLLATLLDYGVSSMASSVQVLPGDERLILVLVATLLGLIAGRRRGIVSTLMLLASLAAALLQAGPLIQLFGLFASDPTLNSSAFPHLLTQAFALLAALRAAWTARKKA